MFQSSQNILRMSVSNKKKQANDSEILETFLGFFFRGSKIFRGNLKCRDKIVSTHS